LPRIVIMPPQWIARDCHYAFTLICYFRIWILQNLIKAERDTANFREVFWKLACKRLTMFQIRFCWFCFNSFSKILYTWRQKWPLSPVFEHDVIAYHWQLLRISQRHKRTKYLKSYSIRQKSFLPLSSYKIYRFTPKNVWKMERKLSFLFVWVVRPNK
jgi:hypothetical protein